MASVKPIKPMMVDSDIIQLCVRTKFMPLSTKDEYFKSLKSICISNHIMSNYKGLFNVEPVDDICIVLKNNSTWIRIERDG